MKRVLIMVLSLLAVSTSVLAQGRGAPAPPPALEPGASQADVDKAVLAAPAQLRNQATVIKWNPSDWSYTTLRKGTNRLVCFDSSGFPGQDPFSVECSSMGNLDRIKPKPSPIAPSGRPPSPPLKRMARGQSLSTDRSGITAGARIRRVHART